VNPGRSLRVALTGSHGLVGSALVESLGAEGHHVVRLVRGRAGSGGNEIAWNPAERSIDVSALEGLDAVINLAGESIAARWTKTRKARIRSSRVRGTELIAGALARLRRPPGVLINASAIGYYGNRGDEEIDESCSRGAGFLAETCEAWEGATVAARVAGIRVVLLRIGVVLDAAGGALPRMLIPFRAGLGGRMGSGRQYMSWVGLDDLVGIVRHALLDEGLEGAVNAVSPGPVRNAEFTRVLGRVLRRPTFLAVPATVIRGVFGEMGEGLFLEGARVIPRRLARSGFTFAHRDLESSLRARLGRP